MKGNLVGSFTATGTMSSSNHCQSSFQVHHSHDEMPAPSR